MFTFYVDYILLYKFNGLTNVSLNMIQLFMILRTTIFDSFIFEML